MRVAAFITVDHNEKSAFEAFAEKLLTLFGEQSECFEELAQERHVVINIEARGAMWGRILSLLKNVALLKACYHRASKYYEANAMVCDGEVPVSAFEVGECETLHLRKVTRKLATEVAKHVAVVSKIESLSDQENDEEEEGEEEDEDEDGEDNDEEDSDKSSDEEDEMSGEEGEEGEEGGEGEEEEGKVLSEL